MSNTTSNAAEATIITNGNGPANKGKGRITKADLEALLASERAAREGETTALLARLAELERQRALDMEEAEEQRKALEDDHARTVASMIDRAENRLTRGATVAMGCFIPLLSLGLSHVGGTLLRADHALLGVCALLLMGCVLVVSLSHLAWAIANITRSPQWAGWLLAVVFDLTMVLCELITVGAGGIAAVVVTSIMLALCASSAFLNCWAFLRHPGH